jgi:hypothetical protein
LITDFYDFFRQPILIKVFRIKGDRTDVPSGPAVTKSPSLRRMYHQLLHQHKSQMLYLIWIPYPELWSIFRNRSCLQNLLQEAFSHI